MKGKYPLEIAHNNINKTSSIKSSSLISAILVFVRKRYSDEVVSVEKNFLQKVNNIKHKKNI